MVYLQTATAPGAWAPSDPALNMWGEPAGSFGGMLTGAVLSGGAAFVVSNAIQYGLGLEQADPVVNILATSVGALLGLVHGYEFGAQFGPHTTYLVGAGVVLLYATLMTALAALAYSAPPAFGY